MYQKIAFLRMNFIGELAEVKVKPRWLHVLQTMGFPFHHVRDWEERKTWKRLHDWPRDYFCWKMNEGSSGHVHSSIFSHFIKHGFSFVSQQIFFRRKGIYLQINRKKKVKKKRTPWPQVGVLLRPHRAGILRPKPPAVTQARKGLGREKRGWRTSILS